MSNKIILVNKKTVACEGDNSTKLGHPKVYLTVSEETSKVICSYCGLNYVYKPKISC